jgi:hypothetical protein
MGLSTPMNVSNIEAANRLTGKKKALARMWLRLSPDARKHFPKPTIYSDTVLNDISFKKIADFYKLPPP